MTSLPPNRRRDTLLRLPLLELDTWHLVVTCPACRGDRYLSINDLALRYGTETTLLAIVPRLRCGAPACRRPPVTVRLRNRFPVHLGPALVDVALLGRPPGGEEPGGVSPLRLPPEPLLTRDVAAQLLVSRSMDKADQKLLKLMVKRVGGALRTQRENWAGRSNQGPGQLVVWEVAR